MLHLWILRYGSFLQLFDFPSLCFSILRFLCLPIPFPRGLYFSFVIVVHALSLTLSLSLSLSLSYFNILTISLLTECSPLRCFQPLSSLSRTMG
ncbi:hypothetical protein Syun_003985 [Stephania yunnanensis]|uniref:Uncharacterized protein n=1 Tax=Stephania yunnanensis TaxID=152371 RepID=A0AAP0L3K7_9MAGN